MTQSFTYDGGALLRVRHSRIVLTQSAELMNVGQGRIVVNDAAGTQAIIGQKDFHAEQDECSLALIGRWFVGDQSYKRALERQGPAREIEFAIEDLNSIGGFLSFNGTSAFSGDRPEETVDQRMAWLDDDGWLPGVTFGTRVASSSVVMDAANYGDQSPTDVIAACALAAQFSGAYIRDFGDGPELVFRNDNTSTADTSPIVISNRLSDVDYDTVFPPLIDFELTKRPGRVASRIHYSYADNKVIEDRLATADAFNGRRDITASDSNVKSEATARLRARDLLWQHHTEERIIEGSILLPPEKVNLLAHGDRVGVRLEHMTPEGFFDADELVYCRVLETQNQPKLKPTRLYELRLKLSPQEPSEPAPPAPPCSEDATPEDTYYPLGLGSGTPTGGSPNPSDGVVYYFRPGLSLPHTPDVGWQGHWHFPNYGAGGVGTIDFMGTGAQNQLIFMVVGNGTLGVQTEAGGTSRLLSVFKGPYGNFEETLVTIIPPGDPVGIEIDDAVDGDCVRFVTIKDTTGTIGGYWGWSGAEWTPA